MVSSIAKIVQFQVTISYDLNNLAGKVKNRRMIRDHPNYSIVKIGQNTVKNHGDFTQTPVKDHQLTLV